MSLCFAEQKDKPSCVWVGPYCRVEHIKRNQHTYSVCRKQSTSGWNPAPIRFAKRHSSTRASQSVPLFASLSLIWSHYVFNLCTFRLLLLHHFAEILCPVLPMLPLVSACSEFDEIGGSDSLDNVGVLSSNQDKLRGILLASAKEGCFRKVCSCEIYPMSATEI